MSFPLSIGMTPSFYDPNHNLLRMQLKCLQQQTCKDFDVWLIDPHYKKRKDLIPELASHYQLHINHVPYTPNTRIAKILDCSIFNAVYCYSESPSIARYSCYRIVRPNWVETILKVPNTANVDFYYHDLKAEVSSKVWNKTQDVIDWNAVTINPDNDTGPTKVPDNCYGNICWRRNQWLSLNGTDEVFTNVAHYEDIQFDIRARNAGQIVVRKANLLYRLAHDYGSFTHRANCDPDTSFRKPCSRCRSLLDSQLWIKDSSSEFTRLEDRQIKVCQKCLLSGPLLDHGEYCNFVREYLITKATSVPEFLIGRNLKRLAEDMDRKSLQHKVEIFNESWNNPRYYGE